LHGPFEILIGLKGKNLDKLNLHNPVFATYVIAATIMILKAVSMSWLTVVRMMQEKGGFRSPEDIRKTPLNPEPHPKQLEPNQRVERIRRIQLNDLENLPFFLSRGWLAFRSDRAVAIGLAFASVWLRSIAAFALCRLFHRADP
jgi:ABC-type glycerol-3-phosphate transport system permease component